MIRRHPILSVVALLVILLLAWAWPNRAHLAAFPDIIGAYTAKEYCSCRYVSGNQYPDFPGFKILHGVDPGVLAFVGMNDTYFPMLLFFDIMKNRLSMGFGFGKYHYPFNCGIFQ